MIYKIIAVLEHKQASILKQYKNKNISLAYAEAEHDKIQLELDNYNNLIDLLYYKFEETYNIRQALEFIKNNNLDKWLVIKYFDSRYKRLFKESKFFTKQYLNMKSSVI